MYILDILIENETCINKDVHFLYIYLINILFYF